MHHQINVVIALSAYYNDDNHDDTNSIASNLATSTSFPVQNGGAKEMFCYESTKPCVVLMFLFVEYLFLLINIQNIPTNAEVSKVYIFIMSL